GVFFFSSRRRHTVFKCDWSSDVCSSDLLDRRPVVELVGHQGPPAAPIGCSTSIGERPGERNKRGAGKPVEPDLWLDRVGARPSRSEERRVGKEREARGGRAASR